MLAGLMRPTETREIAIEAPDLPALLARADQQAAEGWAVVDLKRIREKGLEGMRGTVTLRRDELSEVTAPSMADLEAAVPEGWQLISVRVAE